MNSIVNQPRKLGNPDWLPASKKDAILMAARVPLPLAEAVAKHRRESGQTATDTIIEALEAFFSTKK